MDKHTEIIVFDMAQLAISRRVTSDGPLLRVDLPNVGLLAEVPLDDETSHREGIFRALDSMLATLEIPSSKGRWCRVGLYNPITAQVALHPVPRTEVYTDGLELTIPAYGLPAEVVDQGLLLAARRLPLLVADTRSTRAALAAHV